MGSCLACFLWFLRSGRRLHSGWRPLFTEARREVGLVVWLTWCSDAPYETAVDLFFDCFTLANNAGLGVDLLS